MNKLDIQIAESTIAPLRKDYRDNGTKPGAINLPVPHAFDGLCDAVGLANRCILEDKTFIVQHCYGWGKANSIQQAKKLALKEIPHHQKKNDIICRLLLVHPDTTVNSSSIEYPVGCGPINLGEV